MTIINNAFNKKEQKKTFKKFAWLQNVESGESKKKKREKEKLSSKKYRKEQKQFSEIFVFK